MLRAVVIRLLIRFEPDLHPRKILSENYWINFLKGETLKMFSDTLFTPTYIDDIAKSPEDNYSS